MDGECFVAVHGDDEDEDGDEDARAGHDDNETGATDNDFADDRGFIAFLP